MRYGRGCAEPACISNALARGIDPTGATISTLKVRAPGNPLHGQPIAPCSSCRILLDAFDIKWEGQ
jgi:hypothetical protein